MQKGFAFFLAACNQQRQLLIAIECLQLQLEEQKHVVCDEKKALREGLMERIDEISAALVANVDNLTRSLPSDPERVKPSQCLKELEDACHQLLDTNLSIVQTALAVNNQYGHAPWTTEALTLTAKRTQSIKARLPACCC